ncbi:hypothetical protein, partial [Enterobacter kobei]
MFDYGMIENTFQTHPAE